MTTAANLTFIAERLGSEATTEDAEMLANLSISAYAYDDMINRLLYCERGCSAGEEQMVNNITADGNDPDDYFGPPEIY